MKTYQIELRRTSFVTLTIEAEDQDAAEALAFNEVHEDGSYGTGRNDAEWEIGYVDQLDDIATDETRSYGPQGATA